MKTCEICGTLLFNETDTRCARCLNAGKVRPSGTMPDRSPIMAKPDTRYAIPEERPEYDGIPDPELPYDFGRPGRRAFLRSGTYTRYNPSDAAYKVWLRAAFIWAGVTLVLTLLCAWRHHLLIAAIWTAVTALILGFCTPNRYMQEELLPERFLAHRLSRSAILLLAGGLPAFLTGWLLGWLLGKIV